MHPAREPSFLPLTMSATVHSEAVHDHADAVCRRAAEADDAAAGCWVALLGGCYSSERETLPSLLFALSEATSEYLRRGRCGPNMDHRRRVAEAQSRIKDAVRDGDGAEFAEALVGYDQAIASAVVSVRSDLENPTS